MQVGAGLTVFEYVQRIRDFWRAVASLPKPQRDEFLRRWPDFLKERDPLMWNDDKTALAERFWPEATGAPIPPHLQPPRFADIRAERTREDAIGLAQEVQRRQGGFTARTELEAGDGNRGGPKRHYNDLNNVIHHDARDMLAHPREVVLFYAGHEAGHTIFYPGTQARAEFDLALMEMFDAQGSKKWFSQAGATWGGKRPPVLFQNWLGDQIINYRMQFRGAFGERFHKGMFWLLTNDPHYRETRGMSWFFKLHWRLLWASTIKYAGGYHDGGQFVPVRDVADLPPLIKVGERAYPQVTYHDGAGAEWLRLTNGRYRLVETWKAINSVSPANVRKNLKRIMDLAEPFFFPPKPLPPAPPSNPEGVLCPRCGKADKVRLVPGARPDPQKPGAYLPRLECRGCGVHRDSDFKGVWEFDRDTNRNEKVLEV